MKKGTRVSLRQIFFSVLITVFFILFDYPCFSYPAESEWKPLLRNSAFIQDDVSDSAGARNIVSDANNAAGYLANDGTYFYFRMRMDTDPSGKGGQGALQSFGWGLLFETDGNLGNYEWMLMLNGIDKNEAIEFHQNTSQGTLGDPSDSPEVLVTSIPLAGNFRIVSANTSINGDQDYFLDWRFPYATIKSATGLGDDSPIRVFAGTSPSATSIRANGGDLMGPSDLYTGFSDPITFTGNPPVTPVTGAIAFVSDLAGTLEVASFTLGQPVFVKVTDSDLNTQKTVAETTTITITNAAGESESILISETGLDTGIFTGQLASLESSASIVNNSLLETASGTIVTATYIDAKDAEGKTNQPRTNTILATRKSGTTGTVSFTSSLTDATIATNFNLGLPIYLRVVDLDANSNPATINTVTVTVSTQEGESETLILTETGLDTGVFTSQINTISASPAGANNNLLETTAGKTVTVEYIDALNASGIQNQTVNSTIIANPPAGTNGTVSFVTDLTGAVGAASYTVCLPMFVEVSDADRNSDPTTEQTVQVTIATPIGDSETITLNETGANTGIFTAQVETSCNGIATTENGVVDAAANSTVSATYIDLSDSTGNTVNRTATIYANPSTNSTGSIMFVENLAGTGDLTAFNINSEFYVKVTDPDQNTDPSTKQTVTIKATTPTGDTETIVLTETSVNSGVFTGTLHSGLQATPTPENAEIEVVNGTIVTASYIDEKDASGNLNQTRTDTIVANLVVTQTGTIAFVADSSGAGNATTVVPGSSIFVRVDDANLNASPTTIETTQITLTTTSGETETLTLTETGANTGIFVASLPTSYQPQPITENSNLEIEQGVTITATYVDALTQTGQTNQVVSDTLTTIGPKLALAKTVDKTTATPGTVLTYTIQVRNLGTGVANSIEISDGIPEFTSFIPGSIRMGSVTATYDTATSKTDASDGDEAEVVGNSVKFKLSTLTGTDNIADQGTDEAKVFYKVTVQ